VFAKLYCEWQAHIAQADDGDGFVLQVHGVRGVLLLEAVDPGSSPG
jgi:hypothetical protein